MQTPWRIRLASAAQQDYSQIIEFTIDRFGEQQAALYETLMAEALIDIADDPQCAGSRSRDEILTGLRSYHIARRGKRGRHFILYRVTSEHIIEVVRILYDGMDLEKHIPKD